MTWRKLNLAAKLGAIGSALFVLGLASIGFTLWVTWQLEGGAAAVNEAGRLRMLTWQLAQALPAGDPARAHTLAQRLDGRLVLLQQGDPARPLFVPHDAGSQHELAHVRQGWATLRAAWLADAAPVAATTAAQAEAFVGRIDAFVSAIERQLSHLTTVLNTVQLAMVALVIAGAVMLLYSAHLFVLHPVARLQAGLMRIERGDLAVRVAEGSDDEFGALARGFNRMAGRLQGLYQTLEARVLDKTQRLHEQNARLAVLVEATAFAARAGSLDELAQGFAQRLRTAARADACAVRWCGDDNQRYLLLASDCLPEVLRNAEQCVDTGSCWCGPPRAQATTRVIPIVTNTTRWPHCRQAGYETVLSVPLKLQQRLLGEVNLFFRGSTTLADDERSLLEALAQHLGGAIEALKADALAREAAVAEERALLARELHDSIAQGLAFMKIQTGLLRSALRGRREQQAAQVLDELDLGVHESLADVRELLLHFRTRTNAEDFAAALRTTLLKFEHQSGLKAELQQHGHGLPLPPDVQVQVLHVVQEALSNVRKHAGATRVWVRLAPAHPWQVEVHDDGIGFAAGAADETHVGLRIMRERATRIGALLEVTSEPGAGTCVRLTLPEPHPHATATEAAA